MTKSIDHDPQVLKGILTMVLLRLLAEQESYGYEVVTRLHEAGLTEVNEGTVYPALTRLERDGSLVSRLVASTSGPARKYYRLSDSGTDALRKATQSWKELVEVLDPLVNRPIPAQPRSVTES